MCFPSYLIHEYNKFILQPSEPPLVATLPSTLLDPLLFAIPPGRFTTVLQKWNFLGIVISQL